MDDQLKERTRHFKVNSLGWAALSHFLPPSLLREFCFVLTDQLSGGNVTLQILFDETLHPSETGFDIWQIRPRPVEGDLPGYIQRRIRYFCWGNDSELMHRDIPSPNPDVTPIVIESAARLGMSDFGLDAQSFGPLTQSNIQAPVRLLLDAIVGVRKAVIEGGGSEPSAISQIISSVEMPLSAVMIKHLGDLCADADEWSVAFQLYNRCNELLDKFSSASWTSFHTALAALVTQSIASSLLSINGPRQAVDYLSTMVGPDVKGAQMLVANASHDLFVASSMASDTFFAPDTRAHIVWPTLVLSALDLSSALQDSLQHEFHSADQNYWRILRRQIAIGSAIQSRLTRAFYAKSLFEELEHQMARHRRSETFWSATRLAIESGNSGLFKDFKWSENLIHSYLEQGVVDDAIVHAQKREATRIERLSVVVELFSGWIKVVAVERSAIAESMIGILAELAKTYVTNFNAGKDIGGTSIERIGQLADARPEFRSGSATKVTEAVVAKLRGREWWTGLKKALETATLYSEVLTDDNIRAIVEATLAVLDSTDPSMNVWVVVEPALDFLSCPRVKQWSTKHPEGAEQIVSTTLKFGVNQETEHTRLLFFLQDFDHSILYKHATSSQVAEVVADVRSKAGNSRASNAVNNISALLVCPALSGRAGINDALDALENILKSGLSGRPSISFAVAYNPILVLCNLHAEIARVYDDQAADLQRRLAEIFANVLQLWTKAPTEPLLFAQFSLPPRTSPDEIIVYNWALTSISFAKLLGRDDEMLQHLTSAAKNPVLGQSISKARATRLASKDFDAHIALDAAIILTESRETFYSALGMRLCRIREIQESKDVVRAMAEQCMRHGPNGLDAAVLMLAAELRMSDLANSVHYGNYMRRLTNSRDLRGTLTPLIQALIPDVTSMPK